MAKYTPYKWVDGKWVRELVSASVGDRITVLELDACCGVHDEHPKTYTFAHYKASEKVLKHRPDLKDDNVKLFYMKDEIKEWTVSEKTGRKIEQVYSSGHVADPNNITIDDIMRLIGDRDWIVWWYVEPETPIAFDHLKAYDRSI